MSVKHLLSFTFFNEPNINNLSSNTPQQPPKNPYLKSLRKILELAVNYCIDFDLLTPPYDTMKEVTVEAMTENTINMNMRTGKRLGFMFQADALELPK